MPPFSLRFPLHVLFVVAALDQQHRLGHVEDLGVGRLERLELGKHRLGQVVDGVLGCLERRHRLLERLLALGIDAVAAVEHHHRRLGLLLQRHRLFDEQVGGDLLNLNTLEHVAPRFGQPINDDDDRQKLANIK